MHKVAKKRDTNLLLAFSEANGNTTTKYNNLSLPFSTTLI